VHRSDELRQALLMQPYAPKSDGKLASRNHLLLLVATFVLLLKSYDPVFSPVIGALDPWSLVIRTRQFLATGQLDPFWANTGYPPTYLLVTTAIASLGIDAYDVLRYIPIISALCVIPIYLLMLEIFESRTVAAITALLTVTTRWYFMRTSLGIPEALSQILFVFTLYYVLKSLKAERRVDQACAAMFMAATILCYHFTLVILAVFLALLFFFVRFGKRKRDLRVLGSIAIPAVLFGGIVWFFWVVGPIIRTYFIAKFIDYQAPQVGASLPGVLYLLGYSVGKLGARALGLLGYLMVILALLGLTSLLVSLRAGKTMRREHGFLVVYLGSLTLLAFVLETWYNVTGMAGTGASRIYVFSWLAMPLAAFAGQAIVTVSGLLQTAMTRTFRVVSDRRLLKVILVSVTVFTCLMNLSAINYYKAWSGKGVGLLESHYYVKYMTDDEYRALEYVQKNAPSDSMVLTVGVEDGILGLQAVVSQRTMISIRNLVDEGKVVIADAGVVYLDLNSSNMTGVRISFGASKGQHVYFISGIKKVSSDIVLNGGSPPPKKTLMESLLANKIMSFQEYECVYRNDQVVVLRSQYITIQLDHA